MTVISFENPELTGTYAVLLSNRTNWSAQKILATYLQRWPIETGSFRTVRDIWGKDKYRMRSTEAIQKHWWKGVRSLFTPASGLFTVFTLYQAEGKFLHTPSKPLGKYVDNKDRS